MPHYFSLPFFIRRKKKKSTKPSGRNSEEEGAPQRIDSFDSKTSLGEDNYQKNLINDAGPVNRLDSTLGLPIKRQVTKNLGVLLDNNKIWANQKLKQDPSYFARLSTIQQPQYLWIGCSDSRVPANQIVSMPPGEIFVHRNVANIIKPDDINALSVIQYAVENLKVKHIIVCGHSCCGGVRAALGQPLDGPIESWLSPLRELKSKHQEKLDSLPDEESRWNFLCEENVKYQVSILEQLPVIRAAWTRDQPITIHGWFYSISDGILRDLEAPVNYQGVSWTTQGEEKDFVAKAPIGKNSKLGGMESQMITVSITDE